MQNIYKLPKDLPAQELLEKIAESEKIKIERIISTGQTTPPGEWYNQELDEWVVLLQGKARLAYEDGSEITLNSGDYILIPAHQKHRVSYTSAQPPCIWLAIHGNLAA